MFRISLHVNIQNDSTLDKSFETFEIDPPTMARFLIYLSLDSPLCFLLTLKAPSKICSRRHSKKNIFFLEMADNSHEMSRLIFYEKKIK